jgi:hypothetical protein
MCILKKSRVVRKSWWLRWVFKVEDAYFWGRRVKKTLTFLENSKYWKTQQQKKTDKNFYCIKCLFFLLKDSNLRLLNEIITIILFVLEYFWKMFFLKIMFTENEDSQPSFVGYKQKCFQMSDSDLPLQTVKV